MSDTQKVEVTIGALKFHRTDLPQAEAMVERAKVFAYGAHAAIGQRRKYTDEHYIVHPKAVAEIVKSVPHNHDMLAAAWLHDILEDTEVTMALMIAMFGRDVCELVYYLTDPEKEEGENRAMRKAKSLERLNRAPAAAQTIKLADLIDNTISIKEHDPDFWKVYRKEKIQALDVLRLGDITLWNRAAEQVELDERRTI